MSRPVIPPSDDQLESLRTVEQADVYKTGGRAATLTRTALGIEFRYLDEWFRAGARPVATTLPLRQQPLVRRGGRCRRTFRSPARRSPSRRVAACSENVG